jgi:hypothetical protein
MSEPVKIPHTCLLLDLITGQALNTKKGVFFIDPWGPEIEEVSVLSGIVRVSRGRGGYRMQYTIVQTPLPVISPAPPPEPDVSLKKDQILFLPSPLLRHSRSEEVVASNAVSRTPLSPIIPKKKGKREEEI